MPRTVLAVPLLMLLITPTASAESLVDPPTRRDHRIRTTDRRLQSILDDGTRASPTFQMLVDRLERSDVVVYLEIDRHLPAGLDGRLSFVGFQGGLRYLLVRVALLPHRARQIAVVGHELRHAVEVADAPAIVDQRTMEQTYERIGYENPNGWSGRMFDTASAVNAGRRVLSELRGRRTE